MSEKVANWVGGVGWGWRSGQKGIERSDQPFRMSTLSTPPNTDTYTTDTNTDTSFGTNTYTNIDKSLDTNAHIYKYRYIRKHKYMQMREVAAP